MAGHMTEMLLVLCVMVLAGSVAAEMKKSQLIPFVPDPDQWFQLENRYTGKCVDVAGSPGTSDRDDIQSFTCEPTSGSPATDQVWRRDADGRIINREAVDKCIDVEGYRPTENSITLQLFTCEDPAASTSDQVWDMEYEPTGQFVHVKNRYTGKCMDVKGYQDSANSVTIQQYTCEHPENPETDQWWTILLV